MIQNIKNHIFIYNNCQRYAVHYHKKYDQLESLLLSSELMKWVILDFIIELSSLKWYDEVYNIVLVLVKTFTKFVIYILYHKNIDISELAELIYNHFISLLNMSQNLMSDQNILFTSKFWLSFYYYLSIKYKLFITYYLQINN